MSIKNKIRESLGLEAKSGDPGAAPATVLPANYFDEEEAGLRAQVATLGSGVTLDPPAEPEDEEDTDDEPRTEEEAMAYAAEKLEALDLGHGSWTLIDRALDNISKNTGVGLTDEDARQRAKELAVLVNATDNQLDVLVSAIAQATPVLERGLAVRNVLYRVLQQCVFYANLDYRQAEGMDLYSDEATVAAFFERYVSSQYVEEALARVVGDQVLSADDEREREASDDIRSNLGYDTMRDIQLAYLHEKYNVGSSGDRRYLVTVENDDVAQAVLQALIDIQLLFDLTAQSYGWDPHQPVPYAFVQEKDGSFTPINDAQTALDAQEIKRVAAQKRRREQRSTQMAKAQDIAAAIVAASLKRPTVHRRK